MGMLRQNPKDSINSYPRPTLVQYSTTTITSHKPFFQQIMQQRRRQQCQYTYDELAQQHKCVCTHTHWTTNVCSYIEAFVRPLLSSSSMERLQRGRGYVFIVCCVGVAIRLVGRTASSSSGQIHRCDVLPHRADQYSCLLVTCEHTTKIQAGLTTCRTCVKSGL